MSPVDSEEGGEIRGPCVSSPCVFLSGAPRDSSVLRGPSWRAGFDNFGFDSVSSIPRHSIFFPLSLSLFFSISRFQIPRSRSIELVLRSFQFVHFENYYLRYPRFVIRGTRVERSFLLDRVKEKESIIIDLRLGTVSCGTILSSKMERNSSYSSILVW